MHSETNTRPIIRPISTPFSIESKISLKRPLPYEWIINVYVVRLCVLIVSSRVVIFEKFNLIFFDGKLAFQSLSVNELI